MPRDPEVAPKKLPPKIQWKDLSTAPQEWEDYAYEILNEIERLDRDFETEANVKVKVMSEHTLEKAMSVVTDPEWLEFFNKEQGLLLETFEGFEEDVKIYPPPEQVFRFAQQPLSNIRVIIIGQDPYHGQGQACGLAFSVPNGTRIPPSLVNIFKELKSDLGIDNRSGDLSKWCQRGVLLLNTAFTVVEGQPNSHASRWATFTKRLLKFLNDKLPNVIVVCWGKPAQLAGRHFENQAKLQSPHPSPLSAHSGFFGSKPFSKINMILKQRGELPINWRVN